ncbi:hypothetical protein EC991_006997 [Linnemannia zychae]|nr:hypothetical protein EC991_006997 [Linnemannia zychae]
MSNSVHQWLQNCASSFEGAPHQYPSFTIDQQQQQSHTLPIQSRLHSPYSQILEDSDVALLATIHLGTGSTDRVLPSATATVTDTTADVATLIEDFSMYEFPALLPGIDGCDPSTNWELKPPLGYHAPLIRGITPIPEVTSNSNGSGSEDSQTLNPYMAGDHSHNHYHQAVYNFYDTRNLTTPANNLTVNVASPDQGAPSPPLMVHRTHQQQQQQHHYNNNNNQYGPISQLSAAFLHPSHVYQPISFSPSVSPPSFSSSSSTCNTPFPSTYPSASPSLSSPSICGSPYGSSMPPTPGGSSNNMSNHQHQSFFTAGVEQHITPSSWPLSSSTSSRSFISRSSPIMTRRRSQAFLETQAATLSSSSPTSSPIATLSHSATTTSRSRSQALAQKALLVTPTSKNASSSSLIKPKPLPFARLTTSKTPTGGGNGGGSRSAATTAPPSSPLNPTGLITKSLSLSGYNNALTCQICKKEYANNSTLRRHLKIHAYASTSTATRKVCTPPPLPPPTATTAAATATAAYSGSNGPTGDPNSTFSTIPGPPGLNNGNHDIAVPMSSTLAAVNTHLLSSFWPYRDLPGPSDFMSNDDASMFGQVHHLQSHMAAAAVAAVGEGAIPTGYNPGSDPNIKKPECVGCNKPFARRDTVILHIKNQKRKWDLLCALLPALSTSTSSSTGGNIEEIVAIGLPGDDADGGGDGDGDDGDENEEDEAMVLRGSCSSLLRRQSHERQKRPSILTRTAAGATLVGPVHKRQVRQRRAHPFRVAEKLWQSTLQRKKIHFGTYKKPAVPTTFTHGAGGGAATTTSVYRLGYQSRQSIYEDIGEYNSEEFAECQKERGGMGMEMMNAYVEEVNEGKTDDGNYEDEDQDEDEDGWPSQEALDGMDNQTKLQWMMKMAVEPPCWSERKVRLFGAYGMVEETVLQ